MNWKPRPINKPIMPGGGLLGRHLITAPTNHHDCKEQLFEIKNQIAKSCEYATHVFSEFFGDKITWDSKKLITSIENPDLENYWIKKLDPTIKGKFKGTLTREHILTLVTLCHKFMDEEKRDVLIWGACQSAKTIILAAGMLILPVITRIYHGSYLIPAIDTPNRTNLSLSVVKELETLASVYEMVEINIKGRGQLSLDYTHKEILSEIVKDRISSVPTWDYLVFQRNKPEINRFINLMENKGKKINRVRFIDEIHHGSSEESLQEDADFNFKEEENTWRRIGVSATPSEPMTRFKWAIVPLWIDEKSFSGITRYSGHKLPTISGKEPDRPKHVIIEDRFPQLAKFLYIKQFQKLPLKEQKEMALILLGIYKELVTPEFPVFFLRPLNKVEGLDSLFNLMLEMNTDPLYDLLRYFGSPLPEKFGIDKKTIRRTIKEILLDEYPPNGNKFCMVVSGIGRSQFGDSYPSHTKHYMDLTNKMKSFWDAILQSTEGRAGGFNKKSICYFSKSYVTQFAQFFEKNCKDNRIVGRKRHAQRVGFHDDENAGTRGRPSDHHEIVIPNKGERNGIYPQK